MKTVRSWRCRCRSTLKPRCLFTRAGVENVSGGYVDTAGVLLSPRENILFFVSFILSTSFRPRAKPPRSHSCFIEKSERAERKPKESLIIATKELVAGTVELLGCPPCKGKGSINISPRKLEVMLTIRLTALIAFGLATPAM